MGKRTKRAVQLVQEFSLPLIAGVFAALVFANLYPSLYETLVHTPAHKLCGVMWHSAEHGANHSAHGWEHCLTLHFLINDIFMVLFFGIAAKEITEACLPGGALNPIRKAVNPLLGTLSLLLGKTIGITTFSLLGERLGFRLPDGMQFKQLFLTGVIAGLGLTVALFVSGQAFVDSGLQGAAKMGALFSGGISVLAIVLARILNVRGEPSQTAFGLDGWRAFFRRRAVPAANRA